ncbi:Ferritin-like metal-binding protein YciE [Deinococcus reticulitermitis]|uniref:Ferritin-like metal-binding protein YciE n=1 Tax=Deinococcus reticulitermitis TaxID=856736 RepID=A0A1H6Y2K6_9DEIO|nr:ferritin-like domain-containing protein [Deinococcus reticulitermitis]SEJ31350.1 Ferritin-like metal-binding protein YciE [Deinococcus reticulitermitis]
MAKLSHLKDLYLEQLRDLYSAESQLVQALPKMAAAATDPQLKEGFERHLGQTKVQLERLESLFKTLNEQPGGHTCKAMQGLVAEGEEMIKADATSAVKDAGLIAAAQRVEHYEIAGYGTVVRYAEVLGQSDQAKVLRTTENEEKDTDLTLTSLANTLNQKAAQG